VRERGCGFQPLFVAVVFGVHLGGFGGVVGCMVEVAMGCMGVMRRLFVVASFMVGCSFFVVVCGVLVMLRSQMMMLGSFF
jgi:hypothetical protein